MKLRFLCSTRRRWLIADADATVCTLGQLQDSADRALASGETIRAVRLAGSALECAEILLLTHRRFDARAIGGFRLAAELLARALELHGDRTLACQVIGGSIATLKALDLESRPSGEAGKACLELLHCLQRGTPGGQSASRVRHGGLQG